MRWASDPIRIGLIEDISGYLAMTGLPERHGSELAVAAINASGGILGQQIVLAHFDSQGMPWHRLYSLSRDVLPRMKVEENLRVGELISRLRRPAPPGMNFGHFPLLKEGRHQFAGTMLGGEQQQLATGRALMGNPDMLLLGESSEGVQPTIVQMICRVLRSIQDKSGTTIVPNEQNLDTILALVEWYLVMEKGQLIAEIPAGHVTQDSVRQHLLIR
jgi:branched-chain amino acid transport system ATP-binding protein